MVDSLPTNLTVVPGFSASNLGSMAPGEEKLTACDPAAQTAEIQLIFDRRVVASGEWRWAGAFELGGKPYVVDNIPALGP